MSKSASPVANATSTVTTTPGTTVISTLPRPGSVFDLRDTEVIAPAAIPTASKKGQDDPEGKQKLVRLGESWYAEGVLALGEVATNEKQLADDLGKYAPAVGLATAVRERLDGCRASNAKAQALATFTADQEDVANHDAMSFLIDVAKEVVHAATHDATVLDRYPLLMNFDAQHKQPSIDGKAAAAATREAVAAASNTPDNDVAEAKAPAKKSA